jgi:hypothetical protein
LVEAASSQEVDDIHQELLVGVLHVGNDCNFLAVRTSLEKGLRRVLGIVGGEEGTHILPLCVWCRSTIGLYELVEYLVERHGCIPSNHRGNG